MRRAVLTFKQKTSTSKKRWSAFATIITLLSAALLTTGCMKQIEYQPSQLETFDARAENLRLEFTTDEGRQVAFYIPPLNSPERPPTRIDIFYPGIYAVALGWQSFIAQEENPDTAYLMIEYPGRGLSQGSMHPERNYINSEGALKALAEKFGDKVFDAELNLMGHSFGTGAALQFAERHKVARIVLVAPFNTLRKAVAVQSWLLSVIMPAQIDNRKIIRKLLQDQPAPQITILHGSLDKALPVSMGRELAAIDPGKITYYEFPEDDHVTILTTQRDLIFNTLNGQKTDIETGLQAVRKKSQSQATHE